MAGGRRRPIQQDFKTTETLREETLKSTRTLMLAASTALATWPVLAADVTPERLTNADKEPQNWLMNHGNL